MKLKLSDRISVLLVSMTIILISGLLILQKITNQRQIFLIIFVVAWVVMLFTVIKKLLMKMHEYEKIVRENEKLTAIGQTTSMFAHDVRKPFSSVKSFLGMLPSMRFNDDFIKNSAKEIDKSLRTVESMIEDILEFSRTRELMLENCNPQTLITSAIVEAVRTSYIEKEDIKFEYRFNHQHSVRIDTNKITRAFLNIIGNAIEALKGSGKIWFHTEEVPSGTSVIEFTIGNDGPLIPENKLSLIFDSFFTSGKKKGTGLGLAIAKKVINEHGCHINAHSFVKDGKNITEFVFMLPASPECIEINRYELFSDTRKINEFIGSETKVQKNIPDNIKRLKGYCAKLGRVLTVAIIDDEPIFRNNLRNTIVMDDDLKHLINVIELSSAESAIDLFKILPVDFAIIDVDMGAGMNGLDLAKIIRESYKNMTYVIHSNRTSSEYRDRAQQVGAMAFIPKPMNYETLVSFLSMSKPIPESINCFLADDMFISRNYVKMMLEDAFRDGPLKINLHVFKTPDEALNKSKDVFPDVIFTDYDFAEESKMTGLDLVKEIRNSGNKRSLIYLVTNMQKGFASFEGLGISEMFPPTVNSEFLKNIVLRDLSK